MASSQAELNKFRSQVSSSSDIVFVGDAADAGADQPSQEDRADKEKRLRVRVAHLASQLSMPQKQNEEAGDDADKDLLENVKAKLASARAELAACKPADIRRNEIAELLTKKRNHFKNKTEEYDKKEVKLREEMDNPCEEARRSSNDAG